MFAFPADALRLSGIKIRERERGIRWGIDHLRRHTAKGKPGTGDRRRGLGISQRRLASTKEIKEGGKRNHVPFMILGMRKGRGGGCNRHKPRILLIFIGAVPTRSKARPSILPYFISYDVHPPHGRGKEKGKAKCYEAMFS